MPSLLQRFGYLFVPFVIGATLAPGQTSVLTYRNDNMRTGQNLSETTLSPGNVNSVSFGKLFSFPVDGKVDAQPLIVSNLTIPNQGTHNVVIAATEHDSLYAFDANTGAAYWHVTMLKPGEAPSDSRGCGQVTPEIGITSTPVIDRNIGHGTVYLVAMSKDSGGNYHQRIHAIDITTGAEQFGGPVDVQATYPGTGDNSSGGNVIFDPKQYKDRTALIIVNGVVYTSWASHCDIRPYTSWTIGYNETTLAQDGVFNFDPNGNEGAIWGAGGGVAADTSGNLFFQLGNGTFDTTLNASGFPVKGDFGNAFVKVAPSGGVLRATDYWTMDNTVSESNADQDLGSGGVLLLPDVVDSNGQTRHLGSGAGKDANVYVFDRDNMGKFNVASNNNLYQEIPHGLSGGEWASPAWFNGYLYYGAVGDVIRAFKMTNAVLGTTPSSTSTHSYGYPGTTPSVSASGNSNAILWAVENSSPAVLHAYDANDLLTELYNSNQAPSGRDQFGSGNKFITPAIANGEVFVGTPNSVAVFGLLTATLSSINPSSGTQGASVAVTLTGTGFSSGSTVAVSGTGVTAGNVNVASSTRITATLTIAAGAATGAYNVSVNTSTGTSNSVSFNVNAASSVPTLASVTPNSGAPGTAVNVSLAGTNFLAGASLNVSGTGVTAGNVTVVSSTRITATLTVAASATAGARALSVSTSGGTSNTVAFTVSGGSSAPTLTSLSPSTGAQGSNVSVTLTGTNFVSGASLIVGGSGLSVSNVVVVSSTQITAKFSISLTAATGAQNVSVRTSAGTSNTASFNVTFSPYPHGWQLSYQAETLPVTFAGPQPQTFSYSGFPSGKGILFPATQTGQSITFTINVPKPGLYDIRTNVQTSSAWGIYQLAVNGASQGTAQDQYAAATGARLLDSGTVNITTAGPATFQYTVTGKNAASSGYGLTFDYILLTAR